MNVLGIPSVEAVLKQPAVRALTEALPREVVVECVRECVAALRRERSQGDAMAASADESAAEVARRVADRLGQRSAASLRRVVNATGVVIHTNLGRAPLAPGALDAMAEVARGYCNLEVDVATGERSHREAHVAGLLARLAGAEAATVVNNNAAAMVLTLTALAAGQRVICSRGELVEIGGSFRLPEVIACSGARMVEVGTTNHTRLGDYEAALAARPVAGADCPTAALLKVHRSNFRQIGFTSEVTVRELAELARRSNTLVIFDAGSGLLLPNDHPVFANEPVVRQAVADGADIVTFSTDKLLGGPQGGAIVGRRALVERINRHPLKRALRVGKLTLAGLEATLRSYLVPGGAPDTLVMGIIRRPTVELEDDAHALADAISRAARQWKATVEQDESSIGGGSLPGETIPTFVVWLEAPDIPADGLDRAFRAHEPPIFGRFRRGLFGLDVRTLLPGDADDILACVERLAGPSQAEKSATEPQRTQRRRKRSR